MVLKLRPAFVCDHEVKIYMWGKLSLEGQRNLTVDYNVEERCVYSRAKCGFREGADNLFFFCFFRHHPWSRSFNRVAAFSPGSKLSPILEENASWRATFADLQRGCPLSFRGNKVGVVARHTHGRVLRCVYKVGTPAASVSPSRLLRWWLGCGAARAAISRKHAQRANGMMTHARFNDHFCMYLICSSTRCYVCITLRYLYCVDTI